jgi:hypothetical protein
MFNLNRTKINTEEGYSLNIGQTRVISGQPTNTERFYIPVRYGLNFHGQSWSICFRAKLGATGISGTQQVSFFNLLYESAESAGNFNFRATSNTAVSFVYQDSTNTGRTLSNSGGVNVQNETFYVITWDRNNRARLYINGVLNNTLSSNVNLRTNQLIGGICVFSSPRIETITSGTTVFSNNQHALGHVKDFLIFNKKELSQSEINDIRDWGYSCPPSLRGDLWAEYLMNQKNSSDIIDTSGNFRHAKIGLSISTGYTSDILGSLNNGNRWKK